MQDDPTGFATGERIAQLSVWTLLTLGVIEVVFSTVTGSVALFADGIDSLSDASVSFFVWTGLHFARRRPSKKFPFGYYKVESLTALLAALILVIAASFIFLKSYRALLNPKPLSLPVAALVVLLVTGLVSLYRALQMRRVALRFKILSLNVDAKNSIKDASSSFVAFVSVLLTTLGFHEGADAIGGMLIAFYILTVAYVALRESSLVLLDAFHDPELTKEIESVIHSHRQVRGIKELRLRRAGPFIIGVLEVVVDGEMTVRQMHDVVTELENSIRKRIVGLRSLTVKAIPTSA